MKALKSVAFALVCAGCGGPQWPEPPAVDTAQYQKDYQTFLDDQQRTAQDSSTIVGIWPLADGETAFGSDRSLAIVLPAAAPARAGVFNRTGEQVTITPARGVEIRDGDGSLVKASSEVPWEMTLGSLRLSVIPMPDGRQFVSASDEQHPVLKDFPRVQTYPVDQHFRVSARFDAFETAKMIPVADVRGGVSDYPAVGRLTFRIGDREQQLTAFGFPDADHFSVMFKDATNSSTTYGSRMLHAPKVAQGEWTVLDFNVAGNPPCAYSQYTTCPLPPAENRLAVAIEAGEKRFPIGQGFVQQ